MLNFNNFLMLENLQMADSKYFKTGLLSEEDKKKHIKYY